MTGRPDQPTIGISTLLGLGAAFGASVGIGVFAGVLGDHELGTSPLLALVGTAVGILGGAAGAYQVIRPFTRSSPVGNRTGPAPTTQSARPDHSAKPDDSVRSDET
jgi:F0F1-type ATP synthase assembly protein I